MTTTPRLPASVDTERSVLGSILLDSAAFVEAASFLKPEDFSLDGHQRIFRRMVEIHDGGQQVDQVSLLATLEQRQETEAIGGIAYVADLTNGVPRRPSIANYCRIVRGKSQLRKLIQLCEGTIARACEQGEEPDEILADVHAAIIDVIASGSHEDAQFLVGFSEEAWQQMLARRARTGDVLGYSYGIPGLDKRTGGIQFGDLAEFVLIGAKTSEGKTVIATQCACANAEEGIRVGIFSTEMKRHQVLRRIWTQKLANAGVLRASWKMRDERRLNSEEMGILGRVRTWADKLPIMVYDLSPLDVREFDAQARLMIQRDKIDYFILDHIHEMTAWAPTIRERFIKVAEGIRAFKHQTRRPVLGLAQFPKPDKQANRNKRPTKHDFGETEALPQKADVCHLIYRELDDEGMPTGNDEIITAKGRDSGVSVTPVWFNKDAMSFVDREVNA